MVCIGFDFGTKRIGSAVGQEITQTASPLITFRALKGVPQWQEVKKLIESWQPKYLLVGVPTCIDNSPLHTTKKAKKFAAELELRFNLPVYLVDERLTTIEVRQRLFDSGGYRKLQRSNIDCLAACLIVEQWLSNKDN